MQKANRTALNVKRRKFARAAAMEEFGRYRYWSLHDADGFWDFEPGEIADLRHEAWSR